MLIDSIILNKNSTDFISLMKGNEDEEDTAVGIVVSTKEQVAELFSNKEFFVGVSGGYCFTLKTSFFEEGSNEKNEFGKLELLAPFLFHVKYFKINGNPFIIILQENQTYNGSLISIKSNIENLKTDLSYLGFSELYYCIFDCKNNVVAESNLPKDTEIFSTEIGMSGPIHVTDFYLNIADSNLFSDKMILVLNNGLTHAEKIRNYIKNAEIQFRLRKPDRYAIANGIRLMQRKIRQLENQIKSLKSELNSKDEFIINSSDTNPGAKKVSEFYYTEYEILPLWYKRLGHFIKVMMGNRTFRSLFNDNVKKYKI